VDGGATPDVLVSGVEELPVVSVRAIVKEWDAFAHKFVEANWIVVGAAAHFHPAAAIVIAFFTLRGTRHLFTTLRQLIHGLVHASLTRHLACQSKYT